MKTSSSDNNYYPKFCEVAANDSKIFDEFRNHPVYKGVVETVSESDGLDYLNKSFKLNPKLKDSLFKFCTNEYVGKPKVFNYRKSFFGKSFKISGTTSRYIKNLSDLIDLFGDLDGLNIAEIGGGYGGLCKIISNQFNFKSYTLFDLPPCLKLSRRFLEYFNVKNVYYKTENNINENECFDLVISNYAFSELNRNLQDIYYNNILTKSKFGYLTCNFHTHTWDSNQMTEIDFSTFENLKVFKDINYLGNIDVMCGVILITWRNSEEL